MRTLGFIFPIAIAAIAAPFFLSSFHTFQLTAIVVYSIALLGLDLLTGFNGQISLGHGAFYAIGAYVTAILISQASVPYWMTIPIGAAICFVVGWLFGKPAGRLEGLYLALATFALAVALPQILKLDALSKWTGGVQGIVLDKPDAPFGLPLEADTWLYFLCLLIAAALYLAAWNLIRGRTGRALVAIRDHPIAAAAMGVNTARYKALTFAVSAMVTGIAGSLSALVAGFTSPDSFTILLSIDLLVGAVIGGIGSIFGMVFGAAFIELVPSVADRISDAAPGAIYGAVLIGVMMVMPTGAAGFLRALFARGGGKHVD
jgi:branched-chain amino acid transport system permease protein